MLATLGMADGAVRWLVRRRARRGQAAAAATPSNRALRHWLDLGLVAAVPPLMLLVWTLGGHTAVAMILADLEPLGAAAVAGRAAIVVRDVATMAGLFWLLSRIGRLIESALSSLPSRTSSA